MSERRTTSAIRAAGLKRLERLEQRADSSRHVGPFVTIARRAGRHDLVDRGAALTYYALLSIVPGLLVLFSLIGLLGNSETVDEVLKIINKVGPDSSSATARQPLETLLRQDAESGVLLGAGIIAILWTASAYLGCFFRASASVWAVQRRPVWRAWPLRIAMTILFLALLTIALLIIILTGQLAESVGEALGIGDATLTLYSVLKWPALLVVVVALVGVLYRASPNAGPRLAWWRILTPGGAAAVVVWLVGSAGFDVYVNAFASYDTLYGALGTTIAGLVWLWLTNLTLLMGVELDAALLIRRERAAAAPDARPPTAAA